MDSSNNPNGNSQLKENNRRVNASSPPPAYTAARRRDISTLCARAIRSAQIQNMTNTPQVFHAQPLHTTILTGDMDEMEDSSEESSPISLRISTSLNISQNDNLVCISSSPADQANAIAQAVVHAIQENSSGQCGIPMIDEQGCPRPIKIEVDAGMMIEGAGNVVGTKDIVEEVLRQRGLRRQREEDEEDEDEEMAGPSKRRCSSH